MKLLCSIGIHKRKLLLYKNKILTFILMLMNFKNGYKTSKVGSDYKLCSKLIPCRVINTRYPNRSFLNAQLGAVQIGQHLYGNLFTLVTDDTG